VIGQVAGGPGAGAETSLKLLSASAAYPDAAVEAMRRILGAAPGAAFPASRVESI
jgi:5-oxoprolinase (ATP-hydrolysing)